MAGAFTTIDLSKLPAPNIIEPLNFELVLAEILTDFQKRMEVAGLPFTAPLESDPVYKLAEVVAYRDLLVRQRVNEAARATMIAYATGSDLDNIAANFGVSRLTVTPADDTAIPPVPAVLEDDEDFRQRIPLSLEGYTTAGSEGSYVYHALTASGQVRDVSAVSPEPGRVTVYVLSVEGDGSASGELITTVTDALNSAYVRPMTDQVTVLAASIVPYSVTAELILYPGPDGMAVMDAAHAALTEYATAMHRIGYDVSISGIYQALHRPGVQHVVLTGPVTNIEVGAGQAPYCTAINLTMREPDA